MTKPVRAHRVPIMLNDHELQAIDNWRFANKIGSRSAAMRRLMIASLNNGAPEMLAALYLIADRERLMFAECSDAEEIIAVARGAIAKAEGGS